MVRTIGAQVGLLAFAVALLAGLYAENTATVVLTRGLVAMVLGALVGQIAGWAAKLVLRDYLQRRKAEIDRVHLEAVQAMEASKSAEPNSSEDIEIPEVSEAG